MHKHKAKLLIVEDEPAILRGLIDLFVYHGYDVSHASHGQEGLDLALSQPFDCIILDVMLPAVDGFTICEAIRTQSKDQAIIMLTAKNSEADIIEGLSLGADDYVAKPFSVHELVLRVKNLLNRTGWTDDWFEIGNTIQIDVQRLSGQAHGQPCELTRREMDLLLCLKRFNRPVNRIELLSQVWGYQNSEELDTRTVDIHVAKIRKKIESDPKDPQFLITIRGQGYQLLTSDVA
ncbi:response regulator transcription factor [Marinicella meishanensis]|uniref:response regulator transcription factor n=1 Tax=Marinicella meishanensis TaxID=2873263 RepID=UPI001CBF911A|nr:response regulator transcription factor [Marinicella sp. NBU2979]